MKPPTTHHPTPTTASITLRSHTLRDNKGEDGFEEPRQKRQSSEHNTQASQGKRTSISAT